MVGKASAPLDVSDLLKRKLVLGGVEFPVWLSVAVPVLALLVGVTLLVVVVLLRASIGPHAATAVSSSRPSVPVVSASGQTPSVGSALDPTQAREAVVRIEVKPVYHRTADDWI